MSVALEQLRTARELLSDPTKWTRGEYARDRYGDAVPSAHAEAVCWCAYGALDRAGAGQFGDAREYLRGAADKLFDSFPACVNDEQGHADVLRMYDRAIELAEAQS